MDFELSVKCLAIDIVEKLGEIRKTLVILGKILNV